MYVYVHLYLLICVYLSQYECIEPTPSLFLSISIYPYVSLSLSSHPYRYLYFEVDALGVISISRGCFERCGSNKKTPPEIAPTYSNLSS